ncbi:MAG TPA: PKD domain-containing protein [Planctomycetota bacterium]|nr:PKD domain-containing protein [Planctomycetota bacterium]
MKIEKSRRCVTAAVTVLCSFVFMFSFMQQKAAGFLAFTSVNGTPFTWNLNALNNGQVLWQVDPTAPPLLRESMLAITQAWSDASGGVLKFAEGAGGITVVWDDEGTEIPDGLFLAYTTFYATSDNRIASAEIVVNAKWYSWQRGGYGGVGPILPSGLREANLDSVMLHELGHAIGLDHSDRKPESIVGTYSFNDLPTMNSVIYPGAETLHVDDISGARALYNGPVEPIEILSPLTITATPNLVKPRQRLMLTEALKDPNTTWDLGDGTKAVGSKIRHRYTAEGLYTVTAECNGQTGSTLVKVEKKKKKKK